MKYFILLIGFVSILTACKKDKGEEDPINHNSSEAWLLDPSTGWEHVMSVESDKVLFTHDMTSFGQEIGVIYNTNGYSNNQPYSDFYKVKFKENDSNASAIKLGFSTSGKTVFHSQFIPNSYIPVFTNFEGTGAVSIIDENNTRVTRLVTDRTKTSEIINYHYTKAGDFLGAVVLGAHIPFVTQYWTGKFPTPVITGFMPLINTDKDRGSFSSKMVIPLKLSDDKPYLFTIGTEGTKLKYQVLKLSPETSGTDPNYVIVDQAEFTGLLASGLESNSLYKSLVAYTFDDDVLTFVLADYKSVSGVNQMNKLHCYRWNKRTNGLTTLWESAEVSLTLTKAIEKDVQINGISPSPYLENRLTPDGTFYTIFTKELYTQPQPDQEYAVLYTVNAAGIKELNRTDYIYKNYKKSVRISNCRYMNGAYYALVYPISTEYVKPGEAKFHLEVVKLK